MTEMVFDGDVESVTPSALHHMTIDVVTHDIPAESKDPYRIETIVHVRIESSMDE